ncbi:MAG TPA: hypothetical protein VM183_02115 [Burkholderiales bacterium]|nr:hypothetical protein [Burkholderiales bacterium]
MHNALHLVGSIPLDSTRAVLETFGQPLGKHLACMPDGEIGLRRHWVSRLHYQVFAIHPDIEVLQQPRKDEGIERLNPHDTSDAWHFRVKAGVRRIRFGEPGWRLGFARDAVASYFVFKTLKEREVLPAHLRFQVSLPMVNSAAPPRIFASPEDCAMVREAYAEALRAEVAELLRHVPHHELAIQWDCATELLAAYDGALDDQIKQVEISAMIPGEVSLGFHLCFGTLGGWPRFAPADLGAAVALGKAFIRSAGRRVDWLHVPVLDRSDDAFFAPLEDLRNAESRVYLGMIHNMERFAERLRVARRYLRDFGIGAYCGFGRHAAADLPGILRDHVVAAEQWGAA